MFRQLNKALNVPLFALLLFNLLHILHFNYFNLINPQRKY